MNGGATTITQGIVLGLGAAVPIGPVNAEIARRTLRAGFAAGFALGCGAVSVDVTYAVLSSLSLDRILNRPVVRWTVTVGGIALLLYLAFASFRGAIEYRRSTPLGASPPASSSRGAYLTGVFMTLLNPMTLAFWFLVVPGAVRSITKDQRGRLPMICTGVFIGTICWVVTFVGALTFAGRWRRDWWLALADAAGGCILFGFAVAEVWHALRPFL